MTLEKFRGTNTPSKYLSKRDPEDHEDTCSYKESKYIFRMDKETLVRLAQPAATFALALSVATLPMTVKSAGEYVYISGSAAIKNFMDEPLEIRCVDLSCKSTFSGY